MTNQQQDKVREAMQQARDDVAAIHRTLSLYGPRHENNVAMKACLARATEYINAAIHNLEQV